MASEEKSDKPEPDAYDAPLRLFKGGLSEGRCVQYLGGWEIRTVPNSHDQYRIRDPEGELIDWFRLLAFPAMSHLARYLENTTKQNRDSHPDLSEGAESGPGPGPDEGRGFQ